MISTESHGLKTNINANSARCQSIQQPCLIEVMYLLVIYPLMFLKGSYYEESPFALFF